MVLIIKLLGEFMSEETATESIESHFAGKAAGFSNPNQEPKAEIAEIDPDSLVTVDGEQQPKGGDLDESDEPYTYTERLKKLEISDEDAQEIIDDICEKGSYLKKYTVRKEREGKPEIKVVFMTRDTRTQGFIAEKAAMLHKNIPILYNKIMGELQMAASIIHYNGKDYSPVTSIEESKEFEEELLKRVSLFNKLPAPVTVVISRQLVDFDLRVAAVMSPGYEDFF